MKDPRGVLEGIGKYYGYVALIVLNTVILFVLVNLLADAYLDFKVYLKKEATRASTPIRFRHYNDQLAMVYPNMGAEQVTKLFRDTDSVTHGYDPYTQYKENPLTTQHVNVDPAGFRPVKNQAPWPPGKDDFTIFVFGGSTTFGTGLKDHETMASCLQSFLRDEMGVPANVYNFGRCNFMSTQERILFEKLILEGHVPDVAIFIDGLNDFSHWHGEPVYTKDLKKFMHGGRIPPYYKVLREFPVMKVLESFSAERLDDSKQSPHGKKAPNKDDEIRIIRTVIERYRTNKKMTEAIAAAFGVTPIFIWQPVPTHQYDPKFNIYDGFDYENNMPYLKRGYELMAEAVRSNPLGKNFIWCADIQKDLKEPLYVDAYHYSAKMTRMVTHHILDAMKKRELLPSHEGAVARLQ
jgi:phage shock protein PspC (stress-responsive transcriptional regulator)